MKYSSAMKSAPSFFRFYYHVTS